jgi:transposase
LHPRCFRRAVLRRQFNEFERRLRAIARIDRRAWLLMTTPGVGVIVALTFACAIDDPSRLSGRTMARIALRMVPPVGVEIERALL